MNPVLHDITFGAGVLFLGSLAILGLLFIVAGATTILSRKVRQFRLELKRGPARQLRLVAPGEAGTPYSGSPWRGRSHLSDANPRSRRTSSAEGFPRPANASPSPFRTTPFDGGAA